MHVGLFVCDWTRPLPDLSQGLKRSDLISGPNGQSNARSGGAERWFVEASDGFGDLVSDALWHSRFTVF